MSIPNLEQHCGSWIAVRRSDGAAVCEIYHRSVAGKINQEKYEVLTALQYLARFNQSLKGTK